jgi:large repetitive protein
VDTQAPTTTLAGSGPSGTVATTSATFTFGSSEAGTLECRLDGAAQWTVCTSPRTLTGLGKGSHTFAVRGRDAAGNVDATPAERTWTVDTQAPDTTIGSGPSGLVASDEATFALSATEDGSTFECRLDDAAEWTTCSSPRTLTGLGQGSHTFRVRGRDAAGNVDPIPAERTWTVDTQAPDTSTESGPSGLERSAHARITLASTETGSTFECRLDAGDWTACPSAVDLDELADGEHVLRARSRDAAGNTDPTPAERTWTVDTQAPEISIDSGPTSGARSTRATFVFSAPSGSAFGCRLDEEDWHACASPLELAGLAVGGHVLRVRATDPAGNVNPTGAAWTWTIAAAPPIPRPPVTPKPPASPDPPSPTPASPSKRELAAALRADVSDAARVLRRAGRGTLVRRRGLTVRGLDAALAGRFSLTLRRGDAVLGRGHSSATRSGRHAVRLRLTRTGLRALTRGGPHRVRLHIAFRDASGRTVRSSARLILRG